MISYTYTKNTGGDGGAVGWNPDPRRARPPEHPAVHTIYINMYVCMYIYIYMLYTHLYT